MGSLDVEFGDGILAMMILLNVVPLGELLKQLKK
jgi:hypothetical protein